MADLKETENPAIRAQCKLSHPSEEDKYQITPSTYVPSPSALEQAAKLEGMIHVEAPPGLIYIPNFITEEEETQLLTWLNTLTWDTEVSKRETAQYGFHYNYRTQAISNGREWDKRLDFQIGRAHV